MYTCAYNFDLSYFVSHTVGINVIYPILAFICVSVYEHHLLKIVFVLYGEKNEEIRVRLLNGFSSMEILNGKL
jgi:hypothetical protein